MGAAQAGGHRPARGAEPGGHGGQEVRWQAGAGRSTRSGDFVNL
jgi:hypothetical protein